METDKIREYAALLRELDLTAIELKADGTLRLERSGAAVRGGVAPESAGAPAGAEPEDAGFIVASPMVGMVYIAPAENAEPFVREGSAVRKGDVLCIIEAMKLMNEITAERDGVIAEVLVVNGAVVDYGQPLFRIREERR